MTKYVLKVQLEILQIPHNSFALSAQISAFFGIFLKKAFITCPCIIGSHIELKIHNTSISSTPTNSKTDVAQFHILLIIGK